MRTTIALLFVLGCNGNPTEEPPTPSPVPPVTCDWDSPGPNILEGTIEGEQDFAHTLAGLDLATLPDPLDLDALSPFERGLVNWMVGRQIGRTVSQTELDEAGMLGQAVRAAFAVQPGSFDLFTLREGLQYGYHCSRPFPATLDVLKERYGDYYDWPLQDVECGAPKDEQRLIWRHPDETLVVAETISENGSIRETEVIFMNLREDTQLEFAAYNRAGLLMDRSTFATMNGGRAVFGSPFICISCHTSQSNVDVLRPVGLGAGCRD